MTEKDVVEAVVAYFNEDKFKELAVDTENTARELCMIPVR